MLQYTGMISMLPNEEESVCCGNISFEQIKASVENEFSKRGLPVAFKMDKIKSGMLKFDTCLIVYNPQYLDYHIYVFVLLDVNGHKQLSLYSSGTAAALHIGGAINVDNLKAKIKDVTKSNKQKEAIEREYIANSSLALDDVLIALHIYRNEDFQYRRR